MPDKTLEAGRFLFTRLPNGNIEVSSRKENGEFDHAHEISGPALEELTELVVSDEDEEDDGED